MTVELTRVECRVVGSMIEKAFLTPDVYPMTTNSLVSACNQKTNRDPVVSYDARTIDAALLDLRQRNIVRRVHTQGARSTKHRHALDEQLELDQGELAVISVLLLRGDQTVGELRQRTERQHGFESLEATEACLEALATRTPPLVRQLARQPGHKEARWQHLLLDPDDADRAVDAGGVQPAPAPAEPQAPAPAPSPAAPSAPAAVPAPAAAPAPAAPQPAVVASTSGPDGDLVAKVERLEDEMAVLRRQLRSLAEQLGETLD